MDKASLRVKNGILRSEMSIDDVQSKSLAIASKLKKLIDWSTVSSIHIYSPLSVLREVDTTSFVAYIQKNAPNAKLTVGEAGKDSPVPYEQFEVIIAPLLAFDDQLSRLGFGGGWYDRFLASQTDAVSIGLAYEFQRVERLVVEPHDHPMNYIITDAAVYEKP